MKIAAVQLSIPPIRTLEDREKHVDRMLSLLEQTFFECGGFDLAVLPELSTTGYSKEALAHLDRLSEPLLGQTFQSVSKLAEKLSVTIVYGFPLVEDGHRFISQAVVGSKGEYICHYNKLHIAHFDTSFEKDHFERGTHLSVFELMGWKIGIVICYDIRFPELTRELCIKHGVDVVLHPVAFYKDNTFTSWHHFVITRALENQVYFLSLNQAGKRYGQSIFCPPWIDYTRSPHVFGENEDVVVFNLDKETMNDVRAHYNFRDDKLVDYDLLPNNPENERYWKKKG